MRARARARNARNAPGASSVQGQESQDTGTSNSCSPHCLCMLLPTRSQLSVMHPVSLRPTVCRLRGEDRQGAAHVTAITVTSTLRGRDYSTFVTTFPTVSTTRTQDYAPPYTRRRVLVKPRIPMSRVIFAPRVRPRALHAAITPIRWVMACSMLQPVYAIACELHAERRLVHVRATPCPRPRSARSAAGSNPAPQAISSRRPRVRPRTP